MVKGTFKSAWGNQLVAAVALVGRGSRDATDYQLTAYASLPPIAALQSNSAGCALVADDDEFFRAALNAILRKHLGFVDVVEVGSFDEALEQLGSRKDISAGFFDLSMPGVESPTNLKAVRECYPNVRVAIVSASNKRREILLALEAGVHGYVPKSLGIKDLTVALRTILAGWIYVPPSLADLKSDTEKHEDYLNPGAVTRPAGGASALTPRQQDVLERLVQGKSNKEIARALNLGEGTVKVHLAALFRSMGVRTRAGAAAAGANLIVQRDSLVHASSGSAISQVEGPVGSASSTHRHAGRTAGTSQSPMLLQSGG